MYTLYYSPGAASLVVHLCLLECKAPYSLERVNLDTGEQRSEAYLALNPTGVVPTLVIDGQPMAEAAALTLLLAERHPEASLAPAPDDASRAGYLQWMLYLANTLQPAFRQWFYPADFGSDADDGKNAARQRIEAGWTYIDTRLGEHGPYLLGDRFSAPDLFALMLMRWSRNMPRPATSWPNIARLAQMLKSRPSWKQVCEVEALTEWA